MGWRLLLKTRIALMPVAWIAFRIHCPYCGMSGGFGASH